MAKYLFFLIFLFFSTFYIGGCSPLDEEPRIVQPSQTQPEPDSAGAASQPAESSQLIPQKDEEIAYVSANTFHEKSVEILKNCVNSEGMVNYPELRKKQFDLNKLLEEFNNLDPNEYKRWSPDDRKAFWINVYTLQKIKVVADNYPIQSSRILSVMWGPNDLRHIENKISQYKFLVMDEEFSFKKIEDQFFRKEFHDPRIFLALTDACLSSPPMRDEPYYGDRLDGQLNDQAKKFLTNPLAFKIDREKGKVYLSALFEPGRYGKEFLEQYSTDKKFRDFAPDVRAILNFVSKYISDEDASFLEAGKYSVNYMTYDWTINDGSR